MTYEVVNDLATKLQTVPVALSRKHKRLVLILIDLTLFVVSIYSAYGFRLGFGSVHSIIWDSSWLISLLILIKISVFIGMGIYRRVLRYTGTEFILMAIKAVLISSSTLVVLAYLIQSKQLPRSVLLNDALLTLLFVVGARLWMRSIVYNLSFLANSSKSKERIIIYGAGTTGSQLAQTLAQNHEYKLIAFVDDNRNLHHHVVQGLTVYSPELLPQLVEHKDCSTILLAMPSIDGHRKQQILNSLQSLNVQVKTVPSISEILSGNVSISKIRNVDIADLLGREQVAPNQELLQMDVTGKTVLVTG
ncbi:MAG: polysaccharide biosynthesis protein, partial [Crinalium sp.]